jgi:hypothetical protein
MVGLDKYWRTFTQDVCVPLFSAVCMASRNDVENHPAEEFLGCVLPFNIFEKLRTSWPNVTHTDTQISYGAHL